MALNLIFKRFQALLFFFKRFFLKEGDTSAKGSEVSEGRGRGAAIGLPGI